MLLGAARALFSLSLQMVVSRSHICIESQHPRLQCWQSPPPRILRFHFYPTPRISMDMRTYMYVCVCNISPLLLPPSNLRKYENEKFLQHFLTHTQTNTDSLLTVAIALRGRKIRGPCSPQVETEMPVCIHHDRGAQTLAFLRILGVVQW